MNAQSLQSLPRCRSLRQLLASLYHLALADFGEIRLAEDGDAQRQPVLVKERRHWHRALPSRRLLDLDPTEVANLIGARYTGAGHPEALLGLYALLTALDACAGQDEPDAVAEALHGPSRVLEAIGTQEYHILPTPPNLIFRRIQCLPEETRFRDARELAPRLGDYLDNLAFATIPVNRRVRIVTPNVRLRTALSALGRSLRIGVFPLGREFDFEFTTPTRDGKRVPFNFAGIRNEAEIWEQIERVLRGCRDGVEGRGPVAIAVFPELTISPSLEGRISDWLRTEDPDDTVLLVIAGSFHRTDVGGTDMPVNACPVLQFDGERVPGVDASGAAATWFQWKMNPYRITRQNLDALRGSADASRLAEFLSLFPEDAEQGVERVRGGNELLLFDLPIGRAAVVICVDYLAENDVRLLLDLGVSIVFVPAMSPATEQSEETSKRLGTHCHAAAFCANSAWIVPEGHEDKGTSYVYLPMRKALCRQHPGPEGDQRRFACIALGGLILDVGAIVPEDDG